MAFAQLNRLEGANIVRVDVEATDDADAGAVLIQHDFNTANVDVTLTPLQTAYWSSQWLFVGLTFNSIAIFKFATAGSGAVGGQVQVTIRRPHSLFL